MSDDPMPTNPPIDPPPVEDPTALRKVPDENNPLPGTPMREGASPGQLPEWLMRYRDRMAAVRSEMTTEERVFFESLRLRALGVVKPALSGRERAVLITMLEG